jgi:hypothetical protein
MMKYAIPTLLGLILIGTTFVTQSAQAESLGVTSNVQTPNNPQHHGFLCTMLDAVATIEFVQTTMDISLQHHLLCRTQTTATGHTVTWNFGNTGFTCFDVSQSRQTNNWTEVISPTGQAKMICNFT